RSTSLACTLSVGVAASCAAAAAVAAVAADCPRASGTATARAIPAHTAKIIFLWPATPQPISLVLFTLFPCMILPNSHPLRPQQRQKLLQLPRQRSIHRHRLARMRMRKLQMSRMEKVPLQPYARLLLVIP